MPSKGYRLDSLLAQRVAAGHSIASLARKANVSDLLIQCLENGGNCEVHEGDRLCAALGISLATAGKKDL
jgi:DNA-binding phage protein